MLWPEADGRFYVKAMSYFVEAGHIISREPEYFNLDPEQLVVADYITNNKAVFEWKRLVHYFDNLSLLFLIRQCMFFSVELLSDKRQRSQIAVDIHNMIHSLIETEASVCAFKYGEEVMLSFMGYGSNAILSNWYPIDDWEGELAERLDISNISTSSDFAYFCDLVHSLAREYYRFNEEESRYHLYPIDSINRMEKGELGEEELQEILRNSAYSSTVQYGEDYVSYDESVEASIFDSVCELDAMIQAMDDKDDNPFGEKIEIDDDEEEDFLLDDEPEEPKKEAIKTIKKPAAKTPRPASVFLPPKARIEHIWVGSTVDKSKKEEPPIRGKAIGRIEKKVVPFSAAEELQIVENVLNRAGEDLDLYSIQDKSGINNLDHIIDALDRLIKSGKVFREWSRKAGGRTVYGINKAIDSSVQGNDHPGENMQETIKKSLLINEEIEEEILRVLLLVDIPVDTAGLQRRSAVLSKAGYYLVTRALTKLCQDNKIDWIRSSRKDGSMLYMSKQRSSQMRFSSPVSPKMNSKAVSEKSKKTIRKKEGAVGTIAKWTSIATAPKQIKPMTLQESNCPYGYELKEGRLSIVEEEARLVRRIFVLYNENMTYMHLAERLTEEGFKTRFGYQVRPNLVTKILRNKEFYLGHEQLRYGPYSPIL